MTRAAVSAESDKAYVREHFVELAALCDAAEMQLTSIREDVRAGRRSQPVYVFDDGTEFVATDYFALETDRTAFNARLHAKASALQVSIDDTDVVWNDYLSGAYGICLINVSPETIVEKDYLVGQISASIEHPREDDAHWRSTLLALVDRLDALERPFCAHDRLLFGVVSRDIFITAIRHKYALAV